MSALRRSGGEGRPRPGVEPGREDQTGGSAWPLAAGPVASTERLGSHRAAPVQGGGGGRGHGQARRGTRCHAI
ncbi:hypothetical protein EYF80_065840 [Liparis tanakae]|uniref:Uncharacterized protein n=1 Tax=Liparis tanakae TaxID=230148 RepID=A0A4Z2E530_9TELE|nr:hypothetical protein EYF80_065840 [Liparis tanakae]